MDSTLLKWRVLCHVLLSSLQRKRGCRRRQRKPPNSRPANTTTNLSGTNLPHESHLTNMSGTVSGNHVPLIPSNSHLGKKGSETRAASKPVDASKESNEGSSNPPSLSKSVSSEENTHESDPPSQSTVISGSDSEQHIDLKACTDVKYEKREDVHGVVVQHLMMSKHGRLFLEGRGFHLTKLS